MAFNVREDTCENKAYSIRMAQVLDEAIRTACVKAEWMASVLKVPSSVLSEMRHGTRRIPIGLVPDLDRLLGGHPLLEELAAMEGCGLYAKDHTSLTPKDLETLFALELRKSGEASAVIADALADGVIDPAEQESIHSYSKKMRLIWQDIEDRTVPQAIQ